MLAKAIALAATVHVDQKDKAGKPYILHPMRMMMRLRTDDQELMAIAILHDVIEDTHITVLDLKKKGFSDRVINGVEHLTKRGKESYEDFIERCAENHDALLVKLEDLRDNSDITRLKGLSVNDHRRMEKYHRAYTRLKEIQDGRKEKV